MVRFCRIPSWSYPNYKHHLPEHYYRHIQDLQRPSTRVHDRKPETDLLDLKYNEEKSRVERIPDVPINVIYPKEADLGLWGGEGIIKGYVKPRKYFQAGWPRPKYWFPNLKRASFYSEILDEYFSMICTKRTFSLIDQHCGLDNYILRSDVQDLKSQMALLLRRKMLLTLVKREFTDKAHENEMLNKYSDCIIPLEEAEWFGLPVTEAIRKQKIQSSKENPKLPLKYELTKKLIDQLQNPKEEEITKEEIPLGWVDKVKSTFGINKSLK